MDFVLGSELLQDFLHFLLLITLKIIFMSQKCFSLWFLKKTITYMWEHFLNFVIESHKKRTLKIIFYLVNNNSSYIQLSFVFILYFDRDDMDAFLPFLLWKESFISPGLFLAFFLFILQKDLGHLISNFY